jgi:hypothetical protein
VWDRSVRAFARLILLGGTIGAMGCGSAEATLSFGAGPGGTPDGGTDDVELPPADTGVSITDASDPDAYVPGKCGSSAKAGEGSVCIHVNRGAGSVSPYINEESRAIGIDGVGALYVALLDTETLDVAMKPIAYRTFPSASSSTKFSINTDLPKTADIAVKPGTYYALAIFYDQEPLGGRDFEPGDYVPHLSNTYSLPKAEVVEGKSIEVSVDLFPVRAVDVGVSLKAGVHPIGSGAGPLRAHLVTSGAGPKIVGEGRLPCADVSSADKPTTVRIVTTSSTGSYWVKVALFDFAAGPDDPVLDVFDAPPPPGAIVNYGGSAYTALKLTEGWVSPTQFIELDRVVPFTSAVPADPTPSCVAYTSAPTK